MITSRHYRQGEVGRIEGLAQRVLVFAQDHIPDIVHQIIFLNLHQRCRLIRPLHPYLTPQHGRHIWDAWREVVPPSTGREYTFGGAHRLSFGPARRVDKSLHDGSIGTSNKALPSVFGRLGDYAAKGAARADRSSVGGVLQK